MIEHLSKTEYERIVKWITQLNGEYCNDEVTHSQLLDEAREIGIAVVGLCTNSMSQEVRNDKNRR